MGKSLPDLTEAKKWFDTKIVPKRTTNAGFSPNRIYKSPIALFTGNRPDPNGLCGDASYFVNEKFFETFGDYRTKDGYQFLMVLWEGLVTNHIANVFVPIKNAHVQSYKMTAPDVLHKLKGKPNVSLSKNELLSLEVFDLYYKKRCKLKEWWEISDSALGGQITIAHIYEMSDL